MELSKNQKNTKKQHYDVQIAGVSLRVRSSHDESTVKKLIDTINSKVEDSLAKNISFPKALALTALLLAEEKLIFQKKALDHISEIESDAQKIIDQLDSSHLTEVVLEN